MLGELAERRQVSVCSRTRPHVDAHLLLRALDGQVLVKVGRWLQQLRARILLTTARCGALAVLERGLANGRARAREEMHLAAQVLDHLEGRLERRAVRRLGGLRARKHGGQPVEERSDLLLVFGEVDEQVVGHGQKDLVHLGCDKHLRRRAGQIVKVECRVEGE